MSQGLEQRAEGQYGEELPREYHEKLTFEELKIGNRYISFPQPGDNKGHGGFKSPYYLFQKIEDIECSSDDHLVISNAVRLKDGRLSFFPENAPVIKVE